ncbi:hypothetical protein [Chitinimonas koreensis]|uniref:hypothetical protein n=1 Tax=Chitinimonas koreensis TaxID=356302 RepID=UPI00040712F2|nr:hypothetical protein [Chitinimonas koreensis]QNM94904.1 hypothetical protein H9L41_13330 [Chitinimonas koreensis]
MRIGELNTRAELLAQGPDLLGQVLRGVWVGLTGRDTDDPPQAGLRSPTAYTGWARYAVDLVGGRYLRIGPRLLRIDAAVDHDSRRTLQRLSLTELVGEPAVYRPAAGDDRPTRVFVQADAPQPGSVMRRPEYRLRADLPVVEVGRPQAGEQLLVGATTYVVVGPVEGGDDGIVRSLWVRTP